MAPSSEVDTACSRTNVSESDKDKESRSPGKMGEWKASREILTGAQHTASRTGSRRRQAGAV